jgi:hypothetical protein
MVRALFFSLVVGFVSLVGAPLVQAEVYGDWLADTTGRTTLYAASVNDDGNILGQFCTLAEGSCVWLIGLKASCQKGERHSVLANSQAGTLHLEVLCDGPLVGDLHRYAFTNFDLVDALLKQSGRVGFAIPLQDDQFRIIRFSLRGASTALSVMRGIAEKKTEPVTEGARDDRM